MDLINNIDDIKQAFIKIIKYNYDDNFEPKVDKLFDQWAKSKQILIDTFLDGKLIKETDQVLTFSLTSKEKVKNYQSLLASARYQCSPDFCDFLEQQSTPYDNLVSENFHIPNSDITIPAGMKLSKSFKYFFTDKEVLNVWQSKLSELIQTNHVSGKLCLSVHPLDFLSVSENAHNWRSCHALDGDYAGGNLSYMIDSSTMVCYLKAENGEQYELPHFPNSVLWNSKKWRVLLFVDTKQSALLASRQYPFRSDDSLREIQQAFLSNSKYKNWSEWTNSYIDTFHYNDLDKNVTCAKHICIDNRLIRFDSAIHAHKDALFYNDLTLSSYIDMPDYSWIKGTYVRGKLPRWEIGDTVYCLKCENDIIDLNDSCLCHDCDIKYGHSSQIEDMFYCDCCGERTSDDEMNYIDSTDEYLCNDCYRTNCNCCANCGYTGYMDRDLIWDEETESYYCDDCYHDLIEKRHEMEENE